MKPNPTDKRPQDQTNEEWLAEYVYYMEQYNNVSEKPAAPTSSSIKTVTQIPQIKDSGKAEQLFRYLSHRTTRKGSVAMEFESLNGSIRCTCFFNINLKSSRGKTYPAVAQGQFLPNINGKFCKFWMQAVGKPPPCGWSRVHKSMRSHLGSLVFTGVLNNATDSKGHPYLKLTDVKAVNGHNVGANWSQTGRKVVA